MKNDDSLSIYMISGKKESEVAASFFVVLGKFFPSQRKYLFMEPA